MKQSVSRHTGLPAAPVRAVLPLLIVAALLFTGGCSEEKLKPAISSVAVGKDLPTQESWDAQIIFSDSGRVTGILHAGHISVFQQKHYTALDSSIKVDFFDQMQRHTSVLTALRGRVNDVNHDFEAHGNVVVVSDSGTTLLTEDLYWNNHSQKVSTPAFVDITSPTEHLQGHGFESDQGLKHYTVFNVTGQAKPNE